jgi:signal transduction histidine kinase
MPRLYFRFYAALLASLALLTLAVVLLWQWAGAPVELSDRTLGTLLRNALPPAEAPPEQQQAALERMTRGLRADITLFSKDWQRLAYVGEPLERPDRRQLRAQRMAQLERMQRMDGGQEGQGGPWQRGERGAEHGDAGGAPSAGGAGARRGDAAQDGGAGPLRGDAAGDGGSGPPRRDAAQDGGTGARRGDGAAAGGAPADAQDAPDAKDDERAAPRAGPLDRARRWARGDEDLDRPLRLRRFQMRLDDGRHIVSNTPLRQMPSRVRLHTILIGLAIIIAIAAYPVVRRVTRRLEQLQQGVESLGAGNLSARVEVRGSDEVAALAASFNRSADQIEALVGAHKTMLANASHELRTPLARIRLALELTKDNVDPKRRAGLEQDIAELDQLIDEILLASRLDAVGERTENEELDLLPLAAEECARYDEADLDGEALPVRGDARLLRRMLRNLLENARRHGLPPTTVKLRRSGTGEAACAEIVVQDAGPGIPKEEFDKVFEPFYRSSNARDSVGAGLGLALVRQIARRHGGDARCAELRRGHSAFVVTLPLVGHG